MTRIVFFGFPARGHTVPSLPVVAELVRRGVAVDYFSMPAFQPLVEAAGARFVAYPGFCEVLSRPPGLDDHLARGLEATLQLVPVLDAALEPAPDLVMFDASAPWGGILARRRGVRSVASITTFALNRSMLQMLGASVHKPPAGWSAATLAQLNDAYGAGLRDHLDLMVPRADLSLVYTSREFQPAGKFLDANHLFLGPSLAQRPRDGARTTAAAGARPVAYVSLGTIFNRDLALLLRIAEVLAARGWQVVVSLGDAAAALPQQVPEHVQVHAFVDQVGVLAQARLFVTHGGMNSVSEALAQAVPMIVLPQGVDQHLVAKQAAAHGAAIVIAPAAVSTASLEAAIARMEQDGAAFAAGAAKLQRSFSTATPIATAVDAVLALAARERAHA